MKRALTIVAIIALASGCSGGGTNSAPAPSTAAAPQVAGSTTLTIVYPSNFVRAAASAKSKAPQYVNPTSTNYLDVYVNQQRVPGTPPHDTAQVTPGGNGTQTLTIPLYSGIGLAATNDILVVERDSGTTTPGNLLAVGQTSYNNTTAGNLQTPQVTMSMNVYTLAYSSNGTSATVFPSTTFCYGTAPGYQAANSFYVVPVDADQGASLNLTTLAGSGVPPVTAFWTPTGSVVPPTNITTTLLGEYNVAYDTNSDAITMNLSVTNAANTAVVNMPGADQSLLSAFGFSYGPGASFPASINLNLTVEPASPC